MGGGGFTVEPENPALDDFVLALSRHPVPRLCFLPTASGDADEQVRRFYAAFADKRCAPSHLSLFALGRDPVPVRERLLAQDVIYVGGGSMRNMLAIWRVHDLDRILTECWRRGAVLAGISAGAMCWFRGGVTTSTGTPAPAPGLGLLPGSLSVHLDGEPARWPVFREAVRTGQLPSGWGADDGVGLLFEDDVLTRVVTSRGGTRARRVERDGDDVACVELLPEQLVRSPVEEPAHPRAVPFDIQEFRSARGGGGGRR